MFLNIDKTCGPPKSIKYIKQETITKVVKPASYLSS